ncbi:FeoA family protein [Peptoniphilaceae bacterium SGI.131]
MERITLDKAELGQSVKVSKINGSPMIKRRIMDMGITKNTQIDVIKYAPLGDPIEVRVRGYQLSIRKNDAQNIEVEV